MTYEVDTLESDRWLDQLDDTVNEVFESMLGAPCLPTDPQAASKDRLKVVLRLSGQVERNFCLYFSLDFAKAAVIAFTGDEAIEWEPLVDDALGELGNIVVGRLKTKLDLDIVPVQMSSPSVSRDLPVALLASAVGNTDRDYAYLEHKLKIQLTFKVGTDSPA
jgi:CheY-specific phosphatase CheX